MLIPLSNTPRDYAWGSTTLLAALEGRPAAQQPEAEVWFGDHPADPADLPGGRTLDAITGGGLPYLVKLLAAEAPLSIQAHPSKAQAEIGFAREASLPPDAADRSYRDANHKPELIVALSERFDALAGLRPLDQTRTLLAALPAAPGVEALRERVDREPLNDVIAWALMDASAAEIGDIAAAVHRASAPAFVQNLAALRRIASLHPGDPGLIVAMLMNHVVLSAGEALFLPAGVLHAYLSGLGLEVMAASDNVLRGGLTSKHIDVPELVEILDSSPGALPVQRPDAAATIVDFEVPVSDFTLRRVRLEEAPIDLSISGPTIVIATAGAITVSADTASLPIPVGTAAFVTADEPSLRLSGPGEAFLVQPG